MGFFDTVKAKAGELAADAGRAGKVATAQTRLVSLQNDVRKAERDLGQAVFALIETGELQHPALDDAADALREAHEALQAKKLEIADLRAETVQPAGGDRPTVTYVVADAPAGTSEQSPPAAPSHPVPEPPSAAGETPPPIPPEHPEVHAGHSPAEEAR